MAWHCKATGGYVSNNPVTGYPDSDGEDNCRAAWTVLQSLGWTAAAAAGLLTCASFESGFNPWRWESDAIQSFAGVDQEQYWPNNLCHGYGLLQWTPASYENASYLSYRGVHANKYIKNPYAINKSGYGPNFSDVPGNVNDGAAQLRYLDDHGYSGEYFYNSAYPAYASVAPTYNDYKTDSVHTAAELAEAWVVNFERPGNPANNRARRQALAPYIYTLITGAPPPPSGIPVWLLLKWRQNQIGGKGYI